ncbi:MAG: hypothetical protein ACE5Z5_02490 [Candidatus Bathyarchaeia archaeon]
MPDIKTAFESIGAVRKILEPYEYLPDAAMAIKGLDEAKELLRNPTEENIKAILERMRGWEEMLEPYKAWVPDIVMDILRQTAKLRTALTEE